MKFRRKSNENAEGTEPSGLDAAEWTSRPQAGEGPFDIDDIKGDGVVRVDLGSLLLPPESGRELRLQVDDRTGEVQAVVLTGPDGALEMRAFAAPRNGDLWSQVRPQLAADMARRGGTATEREGRFGTELLCQLTVTTPEGRTATQPSRIVGINGSRWMLRATLLGRPAMEPDNAAAWEESLANVVVRRGDHAMPVGDALPLVMPENARPADPASVPLSPIQERPR